MSQEIDFNDFNNDNHLDIVTVFIESNNIAVVLEYGNGNFGGMMTHSTGCDSQPCAVAVRDFRSEWFTSISQPQSHRHPVLQLL